MPVSTFFYNGVYKAGPDLLVSRYDRGLLLGDGLFETLLIKDGMPVFLEDHYARLKQSAQQLVFHFSMSCKDIAAVLQRLLIENQLASGLARARITISRVAQAPGLGFSGNDPVSILIDLSPYLPSHKSHAANGQRYIISDIRRNDYSPLSRIKSTNYLDNVLAHFAAKEMGAEDALLLNTKGDLVCATAGNVFFIKDQKVFTPPVSSGVLPGITRKKIIALCQKLKIPVIEACITPAMLDTIDALFITNSLVGIKPVLALNAWRFDVSEITEVLKKEYDRLVGF